MLVVVQMHIDRYKAMCIAGLASVVYSEWVTALWASQVYSCAHTCVNSRRSRVSICTHPLNKHTVIHKLPCSQRLVAQGKWSRARNAAPPRMLLSGVLEWDQGSLVTVSHGCHLTISDNRTPCCVCRAHHSLPKPTISGEDILVKCRKGPSKTIKVS